MVVVDLLGMKKWAFPFRVYGTNAIAVFVGSSLMVKILLNIRVGAGEGTPLWTYIYKNLLASWAGNYLGSLIFPVLLMFFWLAVLAPLYKRKKYIKI